MNSLLSLNDQAKIKLKSILLNYCFSVKKEQIEELNVSLASIKDAVESNDKSSAGDKHETSRENANQTLLIYGAQRKKAMEDLMLLHMIKPDVLYDKVQTGAVVVMNELVLYIAEMSDRLTIDNVVFNIVPPNGPLLKEINGRGAGHTFTFNNRNYQIIAVF
jgi:Cu/Ag efflux pump CusA